MLPHWKFTTFLDVSQKESQKSSHSMFSKTCSKYSLPSRWSVKKGSVAMYDGGFKIQGSMLKAQGSHRVNKPVNFNYSSICQTDLTAECFSHITF